MSKDATLNLYITIIGVLIAALLSGVGFYLYQLDKKIEDQSQRFANLIDSQLGRIIRLEKNFAIVVSVLNTKMPSTDLPALVTLSEKKDIPPEKVAAVIPMLQNNPAEASRYLKNEMYFNSREVNAVIKVPPILYKKPEVNDKTYN